MRKLRNASVALAILALGASSARPQAADDRMVPEEGAIHVMLLRQKCVRDELKLTDDETKKIHEHNDRQHMRAEQIHKLPADQRHARYEELSRENERFLDQVLEPAERKRLDEISLQVAGLLMATSPKVAERLNLTDQQKEQLRRHQAEARREMADALHAKSKGGRQEKMKELRQTSRKHLDDVLTPEQEAKWKEMAGKPFDAKFLYDSDEQGAAR